LKIEKNFSLSKPARTTKFLKKELLFYFILFFDVRADASCFIPGNFKKDATVRLSHGRPRGHRPIVRPSVRPSENVRVTTLAGCDAGGEKCFCQHDWAHVWQ
jgi:hypothetical protein